MLAAEAMAWQIHGVGSGWNDIEAHIGIDDTFL
jgi:hypothetical protein